VLGDGLGVGFGCKLGHSDAVGNEALMHGNLGVQILEWLLEVSLNTVIEYIPVFAKDKSFETVEGSDSLVGLVLIGLSTGFARVAMVVMISSTPKVVGTDPHGA
jgi:hypothetical protein